MTLHTEQPDVDTRTDLDSFLPAYDNLGISARIKMAPEDFIVDEVVDIETSGEGEHCWIQIRKRGCNTEWLAKQLARYCDIKPAQVSYAGLKDRHAVTSQWFSVHLAGKETPDWHAFEVTFNEAHIDHGEHLEVLQHTRHQRKLQRGALRANRFELTLRQLSDREEATFAALDERCGLIAECGVPNYFGEQRFGRDRQNVQQARAMFGNRRRRLPRHKRSLFLSAARSWLFNNILSKRIEAGHWDTRLAGDVFMLDGRSACFTDDGSDELDARLTSHDIHPAIVLWGEAEEMVAGDARAVEMAIIDGEPVLRDGLVSARVKASRRASRVVPADMTWRRQDDDYVVAFTLPAGAYATAVLAELVDTDELAA